MNMLMIFLLANQLIFSSWVVRASEYNPTVGNDISIEDTPYQVWIAFRALHEEQFGKGLFCGGALISQNAVLSTARCFYVEFSAPNEYYEPDIYIVVAGTTSLEEVEASTQQYRIRHIIPHENYDSESSENDIAFLFLRGSIPWDSKNVKAIPLSGKPPQYDEMCRISGWGSTLAAEGDLIIHDPLSVVTLHQASIPIWSNNECVTRYGHVATGQVCAGFKEGEYAGCLGDSGGPMVCSDHLSALTSYGFGCGYGNSPGIYTDISHFIHWVEGINKTYAYRVSAGYRREFSYQQILWFIFLYIFLVWI